jgi:hypothetical protein
MVVLIVNFIVRGDIMQTLQHRHSVSAIAVTAIRNPAAILVALLVGLTSLPSRAECGSLAAEVDARCYSDNLQAAVDDAISSDRPLVLPRGTYRITRSLVIDYATHAGTGFELISRGATIDGTSISDTPVLKILCSGGSQANPTSCFYFHQEGTLFVNARSSGYAVVIGKPDFTDAHNSIKIDHMVVNNNGSSEGSSAIQLNYVLNGNMFMVGDSAGSGNGVSLEQVQFSVLSGAFSAARGRALNIQNGYTFANTMLSLDLEESQTCASMTSAHAAGNAMIAPYLNCSTAFSVQDTTDLTFAPVADVMGAAVTTQMTTAR